MNVSACDSGATAPPTDVPRTAQPDSVARKEIADTELGIGWIGLVPWLGIGLSPTSDVQESER